MGENETEFSQQFIIEAGKQIVGFWGSQTNSQINKLGFILKDNRCTFENGIETELNLEPVIESEEDAEPAIKKISFRSKPEGGWPKEEVEEDEISDQTMYIAAGALGGVILIAITIIIICSVRASYNKDKIYDYLQTYKTF